MEAGRARVSGEAVATLRAAALFFFGGGIGTETRLFRTPHRGQADDNEPYL